MSQKSLHIAWIGFAPGDDSGGVPGIATDLLPGLAKLGHRVECFFPSNEHELPSRITDVENLTFIWGTSSWRWNRWYSRNRFSAFVSAQLAGSVASLRLRSVLARRHANDPYDVFYQFSNVENRAAPRRLRRSVPLVAHPGQSSADALRFLVKERRLSLRGRPAYAFAIAATVLWSRMQVQRRQLRGAALVLCISNVFREHLMRDYGLDEEATAVVANPVRLDRFQVTARAIGTPPRILVLGRIATGKGVEDVVALAKLLLERGVEVRIRLVGGTSVWSDYTTLLEDLPPENAQYVGPIPGSEVPAELERTDILLQASKYEAFALTVAEALAAGVPVLATTEVGAIERVDRSVAAAVAPGDVEGMATAVVAMIERLRANPGEIRARARAEAERLFAPAVVCEEISVALTQLADGREPQPQAAGSAAAPIVEQLTRSPS
jgi:glycosyltransferase involved in cell wall biosynthesis